MKKVSVRIIRYQCPHCNIFAAAAFPPEKYYDGPLETNCPECGVIQDLKAIEPAPPRPPLGPISQRAITALHRRGKP